jgi:hypothetical protein
MIGVTILALVFAAGIGVCAWTDALENIWLVAAAAAVIVALGAAFFTLPAPPLTEDVRTRFIVAALIAGALNVVAVLVGRALKRRQVSKRSPD